MNFNTLHHFSVKMSGEFHLGIQSDNFNKLNLAFNFIAHEVLLLHVIEMI